MMEEKFRCHPSIIIEKAFGLITVLFFLGLYFLDDLQYVILHRDSFETLIGACATIGVLLIILSYNILVWYKTFIHIEENTIVIQRNTINSKVNTFGIKNISNINLEQNIFERMIGTYKIKIDTDSLSTANSTDIEIILDKKKAYEFKNKVVTIMNNENIENNLNKTTMENIYVEEDNIEYDIIYSTKDVLKHCFYNLSLLGLIINLAIIALAGFASVTMDGSEGLVAIGLILITSFITVMKFFLGNLFKYYKFSIKRDKDKLYISYGLFRLKKFTVPINRINALNIKQSFVSRVFKKYQSDIVTIGVGDDETEGSQILLSSSKEDFVKNMKIILPEINMDEHFSLERESKNHHIIKIFEVIMGTLFISLILYCVYKLGVELPFIIFLALNTVGLLILVLFYYMSYITRGLSMGDDKVTLSWGIFTKKIRIIKYEKIQYMNIGQTPLSSKLGLYNGKIYILAGIGNDMVTMGYYKIDLFEKLKDKIIK